MSTENVRERIHDIGERVVAEHGEALQILADHDPDADAAGGNIERRDYVRALSL